MPNPGKKGSTSLSQTGKIKQLQKVLDLSERKLINVLEGKTSLPERTVVNVALEIYKRRVPAKTEKAEEAGNKLTLIKVVKNFTPDGGGDVVDITEQEQQIGDLSEKKVNEIKKEFKDEKPKIVRKGVLAGDFDENDNIFEQDKESG